MDARDCFSFQGGNRWCSDTTNNDCRNCKFYKTRKQFREGAERALNRLKKLSAEEKEVICQKYRINI